VVSGGQVLMDLPGIMLRIDLILLSEHRSLVHSRIVNQLMKDLLILVADTRVGLLLKPIQLSILSMMNFTLHASSSLEMLRNQDV